MANGATSVPGIQPLGPVQGILGEDSLFRIKVKPAFFRGIPSDDQGLETSSGKFDQVLLKRLDAEGVLDFEIGHPTFRAFRVNEEFGSFFEESRCYPELGEASIIEIP